jgi:hypothetical protein
MRKLSSSSLHLEGGPHGGNDAETDGEIAASDTSRRRAVCVVSSLSLDLTDAGKS